MSTQDTTYKRRTLTSRAGVYRKVTSRMEGSRHDRGDRGELGQYAMLECGHVAEERVGTEFARHRCAPCSRDAEKTAAPAADTGLQSELLAELRRVTGSLKTLSEQNRKAEERLRALEDAATKPPEVGREG